MAWLGELGLWAAPGLLGLSTVAAVSGLATRRADLAAIGGRAALAAAVLLSLALLGLAWALLNVELEYHYVAAYSGFQVARAWRLAALWSGASGAALTLTFLVTLAAAIGDRLDGGSRQAAGRTATLSGLALVALLLVLTRAQPFLRATVPPTAGLGLPGMMKDVVWQLELWAVFLAVACGAYVFSGELGDQLAEANAPQGTERRAAAFAGSVLLAAVWLAAWRGYRETGMLMGGPMIENALAPTSAGLIALGYVHAPGGVATPDWAPRLRRALGIALFPATLGCAAALVGGAGDVPVREIWTAGIALGLVSGGLAALGRADPGVPGLERVPGFGRWALAAALSAMVAAGLVVLAVVLLPAGAARVTGLVLLLAAVLGVAGWMLGRPAAGPRWLRPIAVGLAVVATAATLLIGGRAWAAFAVASGLVAAVGVGLYMEIARLLAVRRSSGSPEYWSAVPPSPSARTARRASSVIAHAGLAVFVLGLAAGGLAEVERGRLAPGDRLEIRDRPGRPALHVSYLGMSSYQIEAELKRVATFRIQAPGSRARILSAEIVHDLTTGRERSRPALRAGLLADLVVRLTGEVAEESIVCQVTWRPLTSLVWVGGTLIVLAFLGSGRSDPGAGSGDAP